MLLLSRTVSGDDMDEAAADRGGGRSRRPAADLVRDRGTDGRGGQQLKRLDRVLKERGHDGYAKFAMLRVICHGNIFGSIRQSTNRPFRF